MRIRRSAAIAGLFALATLALSSCGEDCTNCPGDPAEVRVSPGTASVLPGRTLQLSALVLDRRGDLLSGQHPTWSSSNSAIASVDADGLVTGVAVGDVNITAGVGSLTDAGALSVVTTSTFTAQVYPILKTSCATAFCHVSPGPAPNMSTQAAAYTAITATYVTPGDSTVGTLLTRLKSSSTPMPPGGAFATLERGNYDLIALWIQQGALNN
jgi:hypothetical protein